MLRMKCVLVLLFVIFAAVLSEDCEPDFCHHVKIKCNPETYEPCDGVIQPRGPGNCDCCPHCAKYKDENEACPNEFAPCRPPLKCKKGVCC